MQLIAVDLLYGFTAAILGAVGACWLCASRFRRKAAAHASAETRHAAEILVRLQELATRAAFDVGEHSSQVEEINEKLASAGKHEPTVIVDLVAELIRTNHRMHEKLASTEDKLREQAQEIQTHAVEARTDALTLLANRRAFDDELARRLAEFRRHGRAFSLVMADVDHFKKFNDAHGHQVGDEVLRDVAKLLRRTMREMDLVARYGGEEFAIILPGASLDDASKAAVRACQGIGASHFRHGGKELRVTASFGIAQVQGDENAVALVTRADQALYAAKDGGRNCAFRHDGQAVCRVVPDEQPEPSAAESHRETVPPPSKQQPVEQSNPAAEARSDVAWSEDAGALSAFASRTRFCQQVRNRTAEWRQGGPTFSVVLIELNQSLEDGGHSRLPAREVAALAATRFLATTVREKGVVGRYAPGCFALLLPTAGLADAIRVAERLRERFSQCSPPAERGHARLSVSVGVVQVMENDDSFSVLKRAEAALDAADRQGGNRAYYHDGVRCVPITAMLETIHYPA
jgi:diguanylate cyclase